jgi:hypothetical protein
MSKRKKRRARPGKARDNPNVSLGRIWIKCKLDKQGFRQYFVYQDVVYLKDGQKMLSIRVLNNVCPTFARAYRFLAIQEYEDANEY